MNNPNQQLFGDNIHEQNIPKILAKYKDPASRKRKLRNLYGGKAEPDELQKIQDVMAYNRTGSDGATVPSDYQKELLKDFFTTNKQLQPVPGSDPAFGNGAPLDQGGVPLERENALTYSPEKDYQYHTGTYPSLEEFMKGTLGETDIPAGSVSPEGFMVHSHPTKFDPNYSEPSEADRSTGDMFGNNFITTTDGSAVNYGKDKNDLVESMDHSYYAGQSRNAPKPGEYLSLKKFMGVR